MTFSCIKCGACCRRVGLSDLTRGLDRGDGTCKHFDVETNLCLIYANRPDVCRVDESYPMFSHIFTRQQYEAANAEICKKLQLDMGQQIPTSSIEDDQER